MNPLSSQSRTPTRVLPVVVGGDDTPTARMPLVVDPVPPTALMPAQSRPPVPRAPSVVRVARRCGWCRIPLAAVPQPAVQVGRAWYHPGGCTNAVRLAEQRPAPASTHAFH